MLNKPPPNKILLPTEAQEQITLIEWANWTHLPYRKQFIGDYLFHIPNERKCSIRRGFEFKKLGVKSGMPDLFFAYPKMIYNKDNGGEDTHFPGLFIEMKRRERSFVSPLQKIMLERLESVGYKCIVAYGWEQARDAILEYLG